MTHDQLVQGAVEAIGEVFSDMSVSQETIKASLEALVDDIETRIGAIECDLDA